MSTNTFDIVLLGESDNAKQCIESIVRHTPNLDDAMLILPDSGGTMEKFGGIDFNVAAVPVPPLSIPVVANSIIAGCTAPYIVLINQSMTVQTADWLEKLRDSFEENTAAVGPRTNDKARYQGRHEPCGTLRPKPRPSLTGSALGEWPLDFGCVMLDKDAWQEIGGFDEKFPMLYVDDWLMRAHMSGWSMAVNTDVYVEGLLVRADSDSEAQALREKWSPVFQARA